MHIKQAVIHDERPLRLHHLVIWRESPLYSERERAALAWTEVLTRIPEHGVSDEIFQQVRELPAKFTNSTIADAENMPKTPTATMRARLLNSSPI